MKTAGLVLDFYDDPKSEILKKSFPTPESLPEVIKTAHILSQEELDILRDEAFALVLTNEGKAMRKFACVDAGNTLLSALYFLENKDSLPEEAQKVAMANIMDRCEEFGFELKSIEKIAAHRERPPTAEQKGATRSRDPMHQPLVGDEADWAERTNLVSVRGGADSGRVIPMANQMKTASVKTAHYQDSMNEYGERPDDSASKAMERGKSQEKKIGFLDSHHKLNPGSKPPKKKEKDSNADCGYTKMGQAVDVSDLSAPVKIEKQAASRLALGVYPLDRYNDVKAAVGYFTENYFSFSPEDRHEFAVKTAARAQELGIATTDILDRYGSTGYSPDVEAHLANRRAVAPEHKELWDTLQEKRAGIEPEEFAKLLAEADKATGVDLLYGGEAQDAYYATFGELSKEANDVTWNWQSNTGDYVSADMLKRLALDGRPFVAKQFEPALAAAFSKDPITIFESLPDLQKKVLARLAAQEFDGVHTN